MLRGAQKPLPMEGVGPKRCGLLYFHRQTPLPFFLLGKVINAYQKNLNIKGPYDIRIKILPQMFLFPQRGKNPTANFSVYNSYKYSSRHITPALPPSHIYHVCDIFLPVSFLLSLPFPSLHSSFFLSLMESFYTELFQVAFFTL